MNIYKLESAVVFKDGLNERFNFPDKSIPKECSTLQNEEEGDDDAKVQEVYSSLIQDNTPKFWCSSSRSKYLMQGGDPVSYSLPSGCTMLMKTVGEIIHERIYVKDEYKDSYRIAMCHYSSFKIIERNELTSGETICSRDSIDMLLNHSYNRNLSFEKELDMDAGNDPDLINWCSSLPAITLPTDMGWFYSNSSNDAFHVNKCPGLTHTFNYACEIDSFLRMQIYSEGKWKNIKVDLSILGGVPSNNLIKTPSMYGDFVYNTPLEIETLKNNDEYIISDYIHCDGTGDYSYGQKISILLTSDGYIVDAVYAVALNIEAESYNNHFNFTDNVDDSRKGKSPIEFIGIIYGDDEKNSKTPLVNFSHGRSSTTAGKFNSKPRTNGMWATATTFNGSNIGRSQGPIFGESKILLKGKIRDATKEEVASGKAGAKYRIIVRLKVQKSLKFIEGKPIIDK